jgi:hypothetical protein
MHYFQLEYSFNLLDLFLKYLLKYVQVILFFAVNVYKYNPKINYNTVHLN